VPERPARLTPITAVAAYPPDTDMAVADYPKEMIEAWRDGVGRLLKFTFTGSVTEAHDFRYRMRQLREDMIRENHDYAEASQKVKISYPLDRREVSPGVTITTVYMSDDDSSFKGRLR
jgi:hypothetical protein